MTTPQRVPRDYGPPADWRNEFERLEAVLDSIADEQAQYVARLAMSRGKELARQNREMAEEIAGLRSRIREQLDAT